MKRRGGVLPSPSRPSRSGGRNWYNPDMRKHRTKQEVERLLALAQRIRRLSDEGRSPLRGLTKAQALQRMRETRERLWEEKIAALGARR